MIVHMKDVIKRYQGERLALDYLNLEVKKGEVVGLLGPNGAGKTTAINAIVGLLDIDEGDVIVFGEKQNGKKLSLRSRIGLVTQEVTVYEDLSAYENLRFFGRLYGLKGDKLKQRIAEVAKLIGLTERLHEIPKRYSGGMKRRLNIGCALLHEPELIIMDEPTVGIDPQSRNYILEFVKELAKKTDTSIIYTSHYIEEVQAISDRVYIIDQGHIIAKGTVKELIEKIKGDQVIVIEVKNAKDETVQALKSINDVKEVSLDNNNYQIIAEAGASILDKVLNLLASQVIMNVSNQQANLEDVFLMLTGKSLRDGEVN
ncbi:ATP-binding cassette domain-containing protein [Liberiplasma polymorphum]|uniref:ABC transporter ATP-binding protein n=1 Tax=Liberiplasma polymorphum TaxID=3374570 RepID=UPI003774923D